MQIDSIDIYHVRLPRREPLETLAGTLNALETVLLRMRSGEVSGWGEAGPGNAPLETAEWAGGTLVCLRDLLAPVVANSHVESGEDLSNRLAPFQGNRFAKAALDMAWWDLHARLEGKPLHAALGGRGESVEVGATVDRMDSFEDFLAVIGRELDAGFPRVKLKVRPGWDERMIDAVRKEYPTAELYADCLAGLGLEHMDLLCRFDDFGLGLLEQPLPADDLIGHAMVQDTIHTPIALDESITTLEQAEMALDLKSCRFINVKPGRTGGLSCCLEILKACRSNGADCFVGAPPQSAVGARAGLALATVEGCTHPADYFPADRVLVEDVAEPLLPARGAEDGTMRVGLWSEPGIGFDPDEEQLEKICIAHAKIG